MNRKLITIAIVLMFLVLVIAPAAATLPDKNPLPKGKPYDQIWKLFQDLQNQITALTTKVNNIPAGPVVVKGTAANGNVISAPTGFTTTNCDIIVRPGDWDYVQVSIFSNGVRYIATSLIFSGDVSSDTSWTIHSRINYLNDQGGNPWFVNPPVEYTVICPVTTS